MGSSLLGTYVRNEGVLSMKKLVAVCLFICALVGFVCGQQYTIYHTQVAYNQEENKFELNVNNFGTVHRYTTDNRKTEKQW